MKKMILGSLIFILASLLIHPFGIGSIAEPRLEQILTELFGMPVEIWDFRVNLLTGKLKASRVRFMNPPEFQKGAHLDNRGLELNIDFLALKEREVKIGTIHFKEPYYFIDRIPKPGGGGRNNISTWVKHIKSRRAAKKDDKSKKKWRVTIGKISVERGTFIFRDRSKTPEKKFVFRNLEGHLAHFSWPVKDSLDFSQKAFMKGMFGETKPAYFWFEGPANFSSRNVGFDMRGEIPAGDITEHKALWENLSFEIREGTFHLKMNVECKNRQLRSLNILILESLKVSPKTPGDALVWGLPLVTSIGFLENQKKIYLTVPVRGDISDPRFEFAAAFRRAFQESLGRKTQNGIQAFKNGSSKIATQTTGLVTEAPGRIVESIKKLPTLVADKMNSKPAEAASASK